jgi:hypothetical protein
MLRLVDAVLDDAVIRILPDFETAKLLEGVEGAIPASETGRHRIGAAVDVAVVATPDIVDSGHCDLLTPPFITPALTKGKRIIANQTKKARQAG